MSWSWSHATEAYDAARRNMERLPRETRNVIAAEWLAAIPHPRWGIHFHAELDLRKYYRSLPRVSEWDDEKIDDYIWQRVEDLATCTNGGWEAHLCPFGCGCHMVPFDDEQIDYGFSK
jgi:hypothetical protein